VFEGQGRVGVATTGHPIHPLCVKIDVKLAESALVPVKRPVNG